MAMTENDYLRQLEVLKGIEDASREAGKRSEEAAEESKKKADADRKAQEQDIPALKKVGTLEGAVESIKDFFKTLLKTVLGVTGVGMDEPQAASGSAAEKSDGKTDLKKDADKRLNKSFQQKLNGQNTEQPMGHGAEIFNEIVGSFDSVSKQLQNVVPAANQQLKQNEESAQSAVSDKELDQWRQYVDQLAKQFGSKEFQQAWNGMKPEERESFLIQVQQAVNGIAGRLNEMAELLGPEEKNADLKKNLQGLQKDIENVNEKLDQLKNPLLQNQDKEDRVKENLILSNGQTAQDPKDKTYMTFNEFKEGTLGKLGMQQQGGGLVQVQSPFSFNNNQNANADVSQMKTQVPTNIPKMTASVMSK